MINMLTGDEFHRCLLGLSPTLSARVGARMLVSRVVDNFIPSRRAATLRRRRIAMAMGVMLLGACAVGSEKRRAARRDKRPRDDDGCKRRAQRNQISQRTVRGAPSAGGPGSGDDGAGTLVDAWRWRRIINVRAAGAPAATRPKIAQRSRTRAAPA
ncbi:MAG: hypothetical protein IPM80_20565 [Proteobacteria bacterium]|nr:hypothetical protein [Pseudomonadota bacterium]